MCNKCLEEDDSEPEALSKARPVASWKPSLSRPRMTPSRLRAKPQVAVMQMLATVSEEDTGDTAAQDGRCTPTLDRCGSPTAESWSSAQSNFELELDHSEGHTYGIDPKEAQARLDDLIDECDSLLNGRALRALRKIDPHAAIGILKNFNDKRDSIRDPSAFVGAAAKKTAARGHGTQQEAVAEVLAQLRDPRNVDGQVWIPNYKERYSGLRMSLRELPEKHTDKFVIHYDGHTKFHVSLCHTGRNKRLMPWRTGRAARRRATNAAC